MKNIMEQTNISSSFTDAQEVTKSNFTNAMVAFCNENEISEGLNSLEFMNTFLAKVDSTLQKGVMASIGHFSNVNVYIEDIVDYDTKTPNILNLVTQAKVLEQHIKDGGKFYSIRDKKAPVIMGMEITLLEVVGILKSSIPIINGLDENILAFEDILKDIVNSKKSDIKINIDRDVTKALVADTKSINDTLATVTDNKVMTDRVPVVEIVKNFKELTSIVDECKILGEVYNLEKLELLHEGNEHLVHNLELIYKSLKKNESKMDKVQLDMLIKHIEAMAQMVTAVAFLYYLYFQLLNMTIAVIKIATIDKNANVVDSISSFINDSTLKLRNMFKHITPS